MIWGMFMSVTMESALFMGKNYLNNCQSIVNTTDLTFKQMFDISTRLVSEQNEISGLETIGWENHPWKYLYARSFGKGHWSFIGPGSEKKWYSISEDSPQGIWDKIEE